MLRSTLAKILLKACEQLSIDLGVMESDTAFALTGSKDQHRKNVSVDDYVEKLKQKYLKEPGFSMALNAGARSSKF